MTIEQILPTYHKQTFRFKKIVQSKDKFISLQTYGCLPKPYIITMKTVGRLYN